MVSCMTLNLSILFQQVTEMPMPLGVEGMSASKMRKAAADDDYETFRSGTPEALDDKATKTLFNTLRKSMKVSEGWNLWEIAAQV